MEGKYLGSAKRGSSDCSSCAASDHIYCQARMEARHNCSKSGFNYTSIGEVWFWVPKKRIDQIEVRTQDPLRNTMFYSRISFGRRRFRFLTHKEM
jgi:hypothetical protein